jgi:membrane protein DedA with SNARE-associated domain
MKLLISNVCSIAVFAILAGALVFQFGNVLTIEQFRILVIIAAVVCGISLLTKDERRKW